MMRPDRFAPERFGTYELLKVLGHGATSSAYLARSLGPGDIPTPIVIKRLHPHHENNEEFVKRFRHEAAVARCIQHDNVARVHDFGFIDDASYIAIEYVPGWPLEKVLDDLRRTGTQMSLPSFLDLATGILNGLTAIHGAQHPDGRSLALVHRDVSPRNIVIRQDGCPKLIDLGLGRSTMKDWQTRTGAILGSPGYMAPEQLEGRPPDSLVDVYAAGAVLYELLTLEPYIKKGPLFEMLFSSAAPRYRPPSRLRSELSEQLDDVLARALAQDPSRRSSSAAELLRALEEALGEPTEPFSVRTVVGRILWSELKDTEVEVDRLFGATKPTPSPVVSSARDTVVDRPSPTEVRPTRLVPRPADAGQLAKPRLRGWIIALAVVVAGAGGMALEHLRLRMSAPPIAVEPTVRPSSPQAEAIPRAQNLEPPTVEAPPASPAPVRAPAPKRLAPAVELPPPAAPVEKAASFEERAARLKLRLGKLASPRAEGIRAQLEMIPAMQPDPEQRLRDLEAVERAISALER